MLEKMRSSMIERNMKSLSSSLWIWAAQTRWQTPWSGKPLRSVWVLMKYTVGLLTMKLMCEDIVSYCLANCAMLASHFQFSYRRWKMLLWAPLAISASY